MGGGAVEGGRTARRAQPRWIMGGMGLWIRIHTNLYPHSLSFSFLLLYILIVSGVPA